MASKLVVHRLGVVAYEDAWKLQERLAAQIASGARPATLLLLEHPHTFTFGRSGHAENLLWDKNELARRGVSVHWVDRGGDITYHGPGQLVGYPLLPLAPGGLLLNSANGPARLPRADYVGYVRKLEETLTLALARLGVVSGQVPGLTGVWLQPDVISRCLRCPPELRRKPAKIAAIGVKVDVRGVSRHGFALNVNPDMEYWEGVVGCGLAGYPVISLADLLETPPSMQRVMDSVLAAFMQVFRYKIVEEGSPLF
jgi:lipoate-protein ligase B